VGEIGYNRREYLYELTHCDLLLIERGYERRHTHMWSASRWETYHIMAATIGTDGLKAAGINSPSDLLPIPGDRTADNDDAAGLPSAEDVKRMRREMMEENAAAEEAARKNTEA